MLVLGIETSCDETAAAVVEDGVKIRSNVVSSQIDIHARYGGVVPELASRAHMALIVPIVREALEQADCPLERLDGIAVTRGPGLIGSLLVGLCMAKSLAFTRQLPLVGINHIEAHLYAAFIDHSPIRFPFLGLVVSGGHTALYLFHDIGKGELLGKTRDDAAGEAFDKVGKLLGLPYPGGVQIDKLSEDGDPGAIEFPRAFLDKGSLDFSFSGMKTSVLHYLKRLDRPLQKQEHKHVVASFQEAVVDVLVKKLEMAAEKTECHRVVVAGGVSANRRLRQRLRDSFGNHAVDLILPPPHLSTDNAVMIAGLAFHYFQQGLTSPLHLDAEAGLQI